MNTTIKWSTYLIAIFQFPLFLMHCSYTIFTLRLMFYNLTRMIGLELYEIRGKINTPCNVNSSTPYTYFCFSKFNLLQHMFMLNLNRASKSIWILNSTQFIFINAFSWSICVSTETQSRILPPQLHLEFSQGKKSKEPVTTFI